MRRGNTPVGEPPGQEEPTGRGPSPPTRCLRWPLTTDRDRRVHIFSTFWACGPFLPRDTSKLTLSPSSRDLKPPPTMPLWCTKTSSSLLSGEMKL